MRLFRMPVTRTGVRYMGTTIQPPANPLVDSSAAKDPEGRKKRYVDALRTLLKGAPATGCKVEEVATGLRAILGEDADPTKFGFEKLSHALRGLQDQFYIARRDTLVPCDWQETMRRVRLTLPAEGVLLSTFLRHVAHQCPSFEEDSLPGHTVEAFVRDRFAFLFHVDVCLEDRQLTVIRRQEVESTKKVLQLQRALVLLGRPPDVPVFTDADAIIPLLPNRSLEQSWPLQLLTRGDIADAFELDVDMLLRIPPVQRFEVLVDGSTVSPIEVRRALLGAGVDVTLLDAAPPLSRSPADTNDGGIDDDVPTLSFTAVRHAADDCHSTIGDVVVDAFMDVADEIVAMAAARLSEERGRTVDGEATTLVVVTGEGASAATFASLLKETFSDEALRSIVLCTPMQRLPLVGDV